ncbi:transcriptional regulator [Pseudomonas aeruginosa]|nr:transcriptional regulator [Pseudomonas aeruginosa]
MELRHLRYFQALARTLNFTRAAEQLHIAQPPLSRQIQQLEEMLGVALLERGRPLRLTEAGRFFHEQSATLLDQLESICDSTRRIGQGQRQWFGIGFVPSALYGVLPELIRHLRGDPELELGLLEMTTLQQVEALKERAYRHRFRTHPHRRTRRSARACSAKSRWSPPCPPGTRCSASR